MPTGVFQQSPAPFKWLHMPNAPHKTTLFYDAVAGLTAHVQMHDTQLFGHKVQNVIVLFSADQQ